MSDIRQITIRVLPDGAMLTFCGRDAWALARLIGAGEAGVTPIDHPGPRWSGYVHKLRRAGLIIQTIDERHGPPYSGIHGRYVLESAVEVVATIKREVAA